MLNESFTDEQKTIFEQYLSLSAEILDANCLDSFITGFRLGARFALDTFIGTDAPHAGMMSDESYDHVIKKASMVCRIVLDFFNGQMNKNQIPILPARR